MLDLNFTKLLILGVIALIIFGPERLPAIAAQAGRAVRDLRKLLDGARSELQENLGPELSQFDVADLNPKHFVRKHFLDEVTGDGVVLNAVRDMRGAASGVLGSVGPTADAVNGGPAGNSTSAGHATLAPGERPPYDAEAT